MSDVAIVGLGIHPFGRHEGVTGLEMAAIAARRALADAGVGWEDVDFAAGGSDAAGNADTSVSVLGLTGLPFINVKNGCATGGSALTTAHAMLASGAAEVALVVGFDKHPPGAFNPLPGGVGHRLLVRRDRPDADHPVLRDEDPALHGRARHQRVDARQGRVEGVRERRAQPERVAAQAADRGRGAGVQDGQPPADAVHVLLARRGRGRAGPGARRARRGELERKPVCLRSVAFRTRRFGSFEVFSPSIPVESAPSPTAEAAAAAFEQAGIGPEDVDVAQLQDTESGAEVMHLAETGLCAARRAGGADPERRDARSAAGCRSTPTAAAWPTASRSARRACARCTRSSLQLRGEAGDRQVPGPPRVGFTQVYGAPGVSACTVLSR